MGLFDCFPLSNAYSVNLDWIMKKIQEVEEFVKNYAAVNKVAYAGVWDITKQYPQWALVTDGDTSWLANKPVPVGIPLENAEYWQKLADLDPRIAGIIVDIQELENKMNDGFTEVKGIIGVTENRTANVVYHFPSLEEAMGFEFLKVGDIVLVESNNNIDCLSLWECKNSGVETLFCKKCGDALYLHYISDNGTVNLKALGVNVDTPNSALQTVFNTFDSIYIPKGIYRMSIVINRKIKIVGECTGQVEDDEDTIIKPYSDFIFKFDSTGTNRIENCHLANMELDGENIAKGIVTIGATVHEWVDYSLFDNIFIRACTEAVSWNSRGVYNVFSRCRFYGNKGNGFNATVSGDSVFNYNKFDHCQFASNGGANLILVSTLEGYGVLGNMFDNCDFEDSFRGVEDATIANDGCIRLFNAHGTVLTCPYFEKNRANCVSMNNSDLTVLGGVCILNGNSFALIARDSWVNVTNLYGYGNQQYNFLYDGSDASRVSIINPDSTTYKINSGIRKL